MEQFITLYNFSPLITVLAGAFMALILGEVLRLSPNREFYNHFLCKRLKVFLERLSTKGYSPNFKEESLFIYEDVINKYIDAQINKYNIFEKRIYLLSFLFCVFLLSFIGVEHYFIKQNYFYALLPVTLFFSFYMLLLLYFNIINKKPIKQTFNNEDHNNQPFINKKRYIFFSFIIWFGILFVSILIINQLIKKNICFNTLSSQNYINSFAILISCVAGFLLLSILYIKEFIFLKIITRNNEKFNNFLDFCINKYYLRIVEDEISLKLLYGKKN